MTAGAWPRRRRQSSSRNCTSRVRCRPFSMPHGPAAAGLGGHRPAGNEVAHGALSVALYLLRSVRTRTKVCRPGHASGSATHSPRPGPPRTVQVCPPFHSTVSQRSSASGVKAPRSASSKRSEARATTVRWYRSGYVAWCSNCTGSGPEPSRAARSLCCANVRGVQMHPCIRPVLGHGRPHTRPESGLASASEAIKDAIPVAETRQQIPPGNARTPQIHNPVQKAAKVIGRHRPRSLVTHGDTELGMQRCEACGGTGHGRGVVKKG